jgi:hypothetical protein
MQRRQPGRRNLAPQTSVFPELELFITRQLIAGELAFHFHRKG